MSIDVGEIYDYEKFGSHGVAYMQDGPVEVILWAGHSMALPVGP